MKIKNQYYLLIVPQFAAIIFVLTYIAAVKKECVGLMMRKLLLVFVISAVAYIIWACFLQNVGELFGLYLINSISILWGICLIKLQEKFETQ